MKGIYLTEEGEKAIEAKIAELEKSKITLLRAVSTHPKFGEIQRTSYTKYCTEIDVYKEILSSATVLHTEESWTDFYNATSPLFNYSKPADVEYPNGVIIEKNKQWKHFLSLRFS